MAGKSPIEWCTDTWNPVAGCSLVSPGCTNCYAMKQAARLLDRPGSHYEGTTKRVNGQAVWTGKIGLAPEHILLQPLKWKRPRRIFVNSMSDLFHEEVPYDWIDKVFAAMALCPRHTFQVLTKRPERMRAYCNSLGGWHLPNVWLGVSVEDQMRADERIPLLLQTPAVVRFLSCEPLLGPIDLKHNPLSDKKPRGIDWVIAGGESGPMARPMRPEWVRSIRDQCKAASVPFFFKQWGEYACEIMCSPADDLKQLSERMCKCGKKAAGRHLDGRTHDDYPAKTTQTPDDNPASWLHA